MLLVSGHEVERQLVSECSQRKRWPSPATTCRRPFDM